MASPDVDLQRLSREEVLALPLAPQVLSGSCSICLEDLDSPDLEARLLPCQHAFHTDCAALWLSKTAVCPNCRASVREEADTGLALDPPRRVEVVGFSLRPGGGSSSPHSASTWPTLRLRWMKRARGASQNRPRKEAVRASEQGLAWDEEATAMVDLDLAFEVNHSNLQETSETELTKAYYALAFKD
eukprot:g21797.t2